MPSRGAKTQNGRFLCKNALLSKKDCYKVFLCVKTVSDRVVRHSFTYLSVQKWLVGDVPLKINFLVKVNHPLARQRTPAMRINSEILRVSDLHRNDYNAI